MRKLISSDEAIPSNAQHDKPCSDCPWSRKALPGWLGGATAEQWIERAHSESIIPCHTKIGPQCAGSAIYRANVCKSPRSKDILVLPRDPVTVFASPMEFGDHHKSVRVLR